VLDDAVWAQAPSVTDFETFIPEFGKRQAERTTAYMAYDRENLYFAFRCEDPEAGRIKAALSRRDDVTNDDFVCINLDTFNDQQSLYAFYINPLGIQGDSRFANNKEDFSIDLIWDSAGRLDDHGYTVEVRVPLKSIRYTSGDVVRMSVFFERCISRRREHGSFPALDPKRGYAFLPQMAVLEYEGLAKDRLLELLPAFTYTRRGERVDGAWAQEPDKRELSLTAKAGITPSLVFDATLNPDFSQVEADAGQVDANLRYNLFFAEKRPFFLEGSDLFNTGATQNSPLYTLVHTRTIVDPSSGFKLSGKVAPKDTIALLNASDTAPPPPGHPPEPDASVNIARYKHAIQEDGYLGGFYTRRGQGGHLNEVAGPDGQIRLGPADQVSFHAFSSRTEEADGSARTGRALGLEHSHDTSHLTTLLVVHDITPGFVADTGYLMRTGFTLISGQITPKAYPGGWFARIDPTAAYSTLRDHESGLHEHDAAIGVTALFKGNASLGFFADASSEVFLGQSFDTSGLRATGNLQAGKEWRFSASYRYGKAIRYIATPFQGYGTQASASTVYQPTENINLTLNWTFADLYRDDTREKVYDDTITRARLTYQVNAYLYFRGIVEYNTYRRQFLTDLLASFTYIPGTVVFIGYGTLERRLQWDAAAGLYRDADRYQTFNRGFFFKASYLWRL
ncbi:MAG TPA: DUF5916 domain-containing protein, partial [Holophagaceae bacterium]|nr:DUF5916 domain-containing protein [Holophagaceae bacterium]